jgi:excisionase family DNA binding protein
MATAKNLPDPQVQGQLLTVRELAQQLRISKTSAYRLVEQGRIGTIRIGGSIRVPADEIARYQRRREAEEAAREERDAVRVQVPHEAPQLTPEAARALLKVLQAAADRR